MVMKMPKHEPVFAAVYTEGHEEPIGWAEIGTTGTVAIGDFAEAAKAISTLGAQMSVTLNAAFEGLSQGLAPLVEQIEAMKDGGPVFELGELVPSLRDLVVWPCECSAPEDRHRVLSNTIIHLNDTHSWPRERIADWLDTLDLDLTFTAQSKGD